MAVIETPDDAPSGTVEEISDAQIEAAVTRILEDIGIDLETLTAYYMRGRFDTEAQRRAWFLISGLGYVSH